jgi:hypothetical protein
VADTLMNVIAKIDDENDEQAGENDADGPNGERVGHAALH